MIFIFILVLQDAGAAIVTILLTDLEHATGIQGTTVPTVCLHHR